MSELLPCPFCGSEPWKSLIDHGEDYDRPEMGCAKCNYGFELDREKWNTRATGWWEIETAPKDGTHLLLYTDGYKKVRVGWFYNNSWHWDGCYNGTGYGKAPTHWRDLPPAPEATP